MQLAEVHLSVRGTTIQLPEVHLSVRGATIQLSDRGLEDWVRVRELVRNLFGGLQKKEYYVFKPTTCSKVRLSFLRAVGGLEGAHNS